MDHIESNDAPSSPSRGLRLAESHSWLADVCSPGWSPLRRPAALDPAEGLYFEPLPEAWCWMPGVVVQDDAQYGGTIMDWDGWGYEHQYPSTEFFFHSGHQEQDRHQYELVEQPSVDELKKDSLETSVVPSAGGDVASSRTTVMIRNLPKSFTRDMLIELMDSEGYAGRYDFLYLPVDFSSGVSLGYAFVNLIAHLDADHFFHNFTGASCTGEGCSVSWSDPHQGYLQHVERYRNSPVMHEQVPDEWKPIVLGEGTRVPFPAPTKQIKAPKIRSRAAARRG